MTLQTDIGSGDPMRRRRSRWPRFRFDVVSAVFLGGCVGGYARYAAVQAWPTPTGSFPWSTLGVNISGAFVLSLVIVIAADIAPSRYLRPLVGTGFCGALTTFSSVVLSCDQLFAHHHPGTGTVYLVTTVTAGLAASVLGVGTGRIIARARRGDGQQNRSRQ